MAIRYNPMIMGAGRRLIGASYREFALEPEVAVRSIVAVQKFLLGTKKIPVSPCLDLSVEAADFGQKMIYPEESTPHPDYNDPLIKTPDDYRKLQRIEFHKAKRMQGVLEMTRILNEREGYKGMVTGFCFGPLGVLGMMRGAERLFRDCLQHREAVMKALETVTEGLIEYVEGQCDCGATGVMLDTLFASWSGLGKRLWEDVEGPFARELSRVVRRKGKAVILHNCGHGPYFDSQIRTMEPVVISFAELPDDCKTRKDLKDRYGGQVYLMGHVSTKLLSYGTPHEVMEECRKQIDDLGAGGRYILAPACEFPPNAPLENALALVRAAEQYG